MELGLKGKVAAVLAASKGLGYACAEALISEGCRLAICARGARDLDAAKDRLRLAGGADLLAVACDAETPEGRRAFLDAVQAEYGRLDILVVNGGGPAPGSALGTGDAEAEAAFRSTLLSKIAWVREAAGLMKPRGWGRILLIESSSVKQPIAGLAMSNTMRAGVAGFAKTAAAELAPDGITVNLVLPGSMDTGRLAHLFEVRAKQWGVDAAEARRRAEAEIPAGRIGDPAEFGSVVAFLASERASYVTGTAIPVDGGLCRGLL